MSSLRNKCGWVWSHMAVTELHSTLLTRTGIIILSMSKGNICSEWPYMYNVFFIPYYTPRGVQYLSTHIMLIETES